MHRYVRTGPILTFAALGKPIPQGGIRHFGKGRPSVHANQDTLLPWRDHVQLCAQRAIRELPPQDQSLYPITDQPVALWAYFTMPKPASAPKTRTTYPATRPDTSHLVRAVEDALTAAGVWNDDKVIVDERSCKVYPGEELRALHVPGVSITVFRVVSAIPTIVGEPVREIER